MTDDSHEPDLEAELRAALGRVANAVPVDQGTTRPTRAVSAVDRRHSRILMASAAAIVVAVIGVAAWISARGNDNPTNTVATDVPATPSATEAGDEAAAAGEREGGSLDGAYLLVSGAVDGVPVPVVVGSEPTLTIEGNQWGGRAACNQYGNSVDVSEDGSVVLGDGASTEIGCEPDLMASESAYFSGFRRITRIETDGDADLVLTGDGVELVFERETPPEQVADGGPFTDIDWRLEMVIEGETASTLAGEFGALRLGSDGSLNAEGPCAVLTGEYVFNGIELNSTTMSADYAASCGGAPGEIDNAIITLMESSRPTVTDGGDRLTLTEGDTQLIFVRRDAADPAEQPASPSNFTDVGLETVVAVTEGLELVRLSPDGTNLEDRVEMADLIPGVVHIDGVAYNEANDVTYVSARRAGNDGDNFDGFDCVGSIVLVDWTGGARAIADGRTAVLSPDRSTLAFAKTAVVGGNCVFTELNLLDVATGETTVVDIEGLRAGAAPDWNLTWSNDGPQLSHDGSLIVGTPAPGAIATAMPTDMRMFVSGSPDNSSFGFTGCCTPPMSLRRWSPTDSKFVDVAELNAPIVSIRAVGSTVVIVDAAGSLLASGLDVGLTTLGQGFLAADGAPA